MNYGLPWLWSLVGIGAAAIFAIWLLLQWHLRRTKGRLTSAGRPQTRASMNDELTIELQYQPAWGFAERAKRSCQEASTLSTPFKIGDPALLALLYSSFSLEAS